MFSWFSRASKALATAGRAVAEAGHGATASAEGGDRFEVFSFVAAD